MHVGLRLAVVVALCAALGAPALVAHAGAGDGRVSPDKEIVVVTANLREAFEDGGDLRNLNDMDVFVRRLLDQTPHAPDVLLLQEVNGRSAAYVARRLTRKSGSRFAVAVDPGLRPTRVYPGKRVHTETAILLNRSTMRSGGGGYVSTSYDRSAARPGTVVEAKRNAHVLAIERSSGIKISLASVHFTPVNQMASERVSNTYRGRWASQVAATLARRYRSSRIEAIGGDFNASRCYSGKFKSCNEAAYWRVLVRKRNYTDSIHSMGLPAGVDYVFARSRILDAGLDLSYDSEAAQRGRMPYYSDHMFRWAMLGPR